MSSVDRWLFPFLRRVRRWFWLRRAWQRYVRDLEAENDRLRAKVESMRIRPDPNPRMEPVELKDGLGI